MSVSSDLPLVIALGGNAMLRQRERGTFEEQYRNVQYTTSKIGKLIHSGRKVVITHGNGPQIGATLIRHEAGKHLVPPLPLHACGAETQGFLGYLIQQSLQSELARLGEKKMVVTLITQVVVDPNDPAFRKPTKPIGPFYTEVEKDRLVKEQKQLAMEEDSGRGFRRVVASPDPISVEETEAVQSLVDNGVVVITCGGGGIPVVKSEGLSQGIDAVIDKDLAAEKLATSIGAKELVIMTDVDGVYLNYRKPEQKLLSKVSLKELATYARQTHFAPGSMAPKIEAALRFLRNGGERVVIARLDAIEEAVDGTAGTQITR